MIIDNLMQNAGFEGGTMAWTQTSSGGYSLIASATVIPAHAGSTYALLGGYDSASDRIEQSLTIPANTNSTNLEFWTQITSQETSCTSCDKLTVAVYNTSGSLLCTLTTLSNQTASSGWVKNSGFDLTAYQDQTVRLRFTASTNASNNTRFLINDVKLSATVLYTQSIAFGPAPSVLEGSTVSATASSGLSVTLSSSTTRTCVLSGTTVTGISLGKCTITANQAGDTAYLPAPPTTLNLSITTPAVIVAYAATCSARSLPTKTASGSGLTLTVRGLKGGVTYSCTATAPLPRSPSRRNPVAAA